MSKQAEIKNMKPDIKLSKTVRDDAKVMLDNVSFASVNLEEQLLQSNYVKELAPIIDILFPAMTHSPSKLPETTQTLLNAGMKITYKDPMDTASINAMHQAYVARIGRARYEIFINGLTEEAAFEEMDLHEKGHILYQHTDGINFYLKEFEQHIERIWDEKIAKWFTADVHKNVKRDKIVKFLYAQFSNIAQDMEINSKLFEDEWIDAKKLMSRSTLIMMYKMLLNEFDDLSGLIKNEKARDVESKQYKQLYAKFDIIMKNLQFRIEGKIDDFQYCHPAQKGWPEKLDWMFYMRLLIKDADDVMQQISQMAQIAAGGMKGNSNSNSNGKGKSNSQSQSGEGDSEGDDDSEGKDDGSGDGGKKISQDVLEDYFDGEDAKETSGGSGDEDDEDDEFDDVPTTRGRSEGGEGMSKKGGGSAWKGEIETCDSFASFTKLLNRLCMGKKNRRLNTDVMYYSNRRKIQGNVITPRRHLIEKYMPEAVTIVVDISGSVSTSYVERVINAIVDANAGIDMHNSHIIFCDTDVRSDEVLSKRTRDVFSGGGTHIASGITYAKQYMKKPTDKLFIISDFEDSLEAWIEAADGMTGIKYAIGYNVNSQKDFDATRIMERYAPRSGNSGLNKFTSIFRVLFITEVIDER